MRFVVLSEIVVSHTIGAVGSSEWLTSRFVPHLTPSTEPAVHLMIMALTIAYLV